MLKRLISVILIFCLILSAFCGCSEEEKINVFFPIDADPECLDPQIAEKDSAKLITYNCMEGLVRIDSEGKIQPGVAESWSVSEDGMTYTFSIRDNSYWQMLKSHKNVLGDDYESTFSTRVTAGDCAFGIERALRPETKAENAFLLFPIKNAEKFNAGEVGRDALGIKAVDDKKLVIQLERVYPDFLRILCEPMCMPCDEEFFLATGAKYGLELKYTLCNGPFYVGRWIEDGSLTLYKNELFTGYKPFSTDAVYLYVNEDEQKYISKFNQGDYNAMKVSPENYSLVNDDDTGILSTANKVYGFIFNCADPVLSDLNIRKSLIYASDMSDLFNGDVDFEKAGGVVPYSCRWESSSYRDVVGDVRIPSYNPQKAKEFFKDGLEELELTNLSVSILCEEQFRLPIVRLIQKWEKTFGLSITVSVDTVGSDELEEFIDNGQFQIAFTSLLADEGSALCFLESFVTDNVFNSGNFSNEEYDKTITKCKTTYVGNDIINKFYYAEQMLIDNVAFIPAYSSENRAYVSDNLKDVFGLYGFVYFDFAGWEDLDQN